MAILTFGTDTPHFSPIGAANTAETTAARIAPNMQRGVGLIGAGAVPISLPFAATADTWTRFHYYVTTHQNDSNLASWFGGGVELFRLRRKSGSPVTLIFDYWNGSTWVTAISMTTDSAAVRYKVDVHVNVSNTGAIEVYYDDVLRGSFSGDTLLTAQTTLDQLTISSSAANSGSQYQVVSGVFVADEDTRGITAVDLSVNGAGAHTAWTGAYTDVDELGIPSDADYLATLNVGDIETFTKQALPGGFSSGYNVVGLGVSARALKSTGSPPNLNLQTRSGTTDGSSANKALDTVYAPHKHIFATDPATAAAWTVAAVDAAQVGVKSAS